MNSMAIAIVVSFAAGALFGTAIKTLESPDFSGRVEIRAANSESVKAALGATPEPAVETQRCFEIGGGGQHCR